MDYSKKYRIPIVLINHNIHKTKYQINQQMTDQRKFRPQKYVILCQSFCIRFCSILVCAHIQSLREYIVNKLFR